MHDECLFRAQLIAILCLTTAFLIGKYGPVRGRGTSPQVAPVANG